MDTISRDKKKFDGVFPYVGNSVRAANLATSLFLGANALEKCPQNSCTVNGETLSELQRSAARNILSSLDSKGLSLAWGKTRQEMQKPVSLLNKALLRVTFRDQPELASAFIRDVTGKNSFPLADLSAPGELQNSSEYLGITADFLCISPNGTQADVVVPDGKTSLSSQALLHLAHLVTNSEYGDAEDPVLPESWTIFLCRKDPLGQGKLLYGAEDGFFPKTHIYNAVLFNCSFLQQAGSWQEAVQKRPDSISADRWLRLLRWCWDLTCTDCSSIRNGKLRERVKFVTEPIPGAGYSLLQHEVMRVFLQFQDDFHGDHCPEERLLMQAKQEELEVRALLANGKTPGAVSSFYGIPLYRVKSIQAATPVQAFQVA